MSTAYYRPEDKSLLGVRSFEKAGEEKPRACFTWAINPVHYLYEAHAHLVIDEQGSVYDWFDFVRKIVGECEVQHFDIRNIPAG
jgi:hypothetical protein